MKAFDKISLIVGKIVIFIITFLSCFYTVDLLCTYLKPVLSIVFKWLETNRDYVTLGSFALIVAVGYIIYILTDDNYRKSFTGKFGKSKRLKEEEPPKMVIQPTEGLMDLNEDVE